eukprot:m.105645 g.105645  ORF g.105645 m.105645 type:complete len:87 (-) comp13885_c0_seq1:3140-3400(-)
MRDTKQPSPKRRNTKHKAPLLPPNISARRSRVHTPQKTKPKDRKAENEEEKGITDEQVLDALMSWNTTTTTTSTISSRILQKMIWT